MGRRSSSSGRRRRNGRKRSCILRRGWTFEIAPVSGGGAELRITEDGEIYNVIFRFMARFVFGYTASIERYLRDLGAKFGQGVEIEA